MNCLDFKHRMLRMIVAEPRVMRDFTEGTLHQITISARHVERWVAELIAEGLVRKCEDTFYPTKAGMVEVSRPPSIATSRVICGASTSEPYRSTWAPIRAGADQNKQYRSLGF